MVATMITPTTLAAAPSGGTDAEVKQRALQAYAELILRGNPTPEELDAALTLLGAGGFTGNEITLIQAAVSEAKKAQETQKTVPDIIGAGGGVVAATTPQGGAVAGGANVTAVTTPTGDAVKTEFVGAGVNPDGTAVAAAGNLNAAQIGGATVVHGGVAGAAAMPGGGLIAGAGSGAAAGSHVAALQQQPQQISILSK